MRRAAGAAGAALIVASFFAAPGSARVVDRGPEPAAMGGISAVWNTPGSPYAPGDSVVALTFDDGPDPTYTPQVLAVLQRMQVPASFFLLGREVAAHGDVAHTITADGYSVANHTWSHVDLTSIDAAAYRHQVDDTSDVIESSTGVRPACLRPPGGRIDSTVTARLSDRQLTAVGWSVDPSDWQSPGARTIVDRVLGNVRAGSIVLLHDGGGDRSQTVAALPAIIDGLRARGLQPVSICTPVAPRPPTSPEDVLVSAHWFLRSTATTGPADIEFTYGEPGDHPIVGDWDGDGLATPGVVRGNALLLRNNNTSGAAEIVFTYGDPGDRVIVGDWDGDGVDTVGVVRGNVFLLRNRNTSGPADVAFVYGDPNDDVVVGKWVAHSVGDTVGVVRRNQVLLRDSNTSGTADIAFTYGDSGDTIVTGDWDGNGTDTPAVVRGALYLARLTNDSGVAEWGFVYGDPSDDCRLVGHWSTTDGPAPDGPGIAR